AAGTGGQGRRARPGPDAGAHAGARPRARRDQLGARGRRRGAAGVLHPVRPAPRDRPPLLRLLRGTGQLSDPGRGFLELGTEVAGYRIEAFIGRGGMAVVYRAEDLRLGRKVALKLLAPELSA